MTNATTETLPSLPFNLFGPLPIKYEPYGPPFNPSMRQMRPSLHCDKCDTPFNTTLPSMRPPFNVINATIFKNATNTTPSALPKKCDTYPLPFALPEKCDTFGPPQKMRHLWPSLQPSPKNATCSAFSLALPTNHKIL
ncbi:hypothetical protein O6H91_13G042000 [Diphasiastrum complanatum]|uniref:Uncharacterized protein n=1 Tax=Diphasiastrum complanatum TaxID=34168 RepID=A0ACC2BUB8_DIPCM|nr:hypothetical protein O6H91_13G042000 [Diphasiastrum complanatum]